MKNTNNNNNIEYKEFEANIVISTFISAIYDAFSALVKMSHIFSMILVFYLFYIVAGKQNFVLFVVTPILVYIVYKVMFYYDVITNMDDNPFDDNDDDENE